jgi:flavin reductase (DIM6/NTAB) family NADH-FMN oxidoreductase RutF
VSGSVRLQDVFHRVPHGVSVVTVETPEQRLGLTIATVISLSLEPPLVGFAVSRQAALHEILLEANRFAISLLAADQAEIAEHFARGVPPIAHWHGIALEPELEPGSAPRIAGALGWIEGTIVWTAAAGTHTFVAGAVDSAADGPAEDALLRVRGEWASA